VTPGSPLSEVDSPHLHKARVAAWQLRTLELFLEPSVLFHDVSIATERSSIPVTEIDLDDVARSNF
jgi:hypothetical protein